MGGAVMNALLLKGIVATSLIGVVSGTSFWLGKRYAAPSAPQPCMVAIPNAPAFTYTEKEKQEHAKFYRDFNQGPPGAKNPKKWIVP